MIKAASDTRSFFHQHLEAALDGLGVQASAPTCHYLQELLAQGATLGAQDEPVALLLAEALQEDGPRERREKLRETGDTALYTSGFFQEHVQRRGMSLAYYETMGGRAYASAAVLPGPLRHVFQELAQGFARFVQVLDEVREATTLRTPQDIVRLYDRWRETKSPKLARRLQREGVFPGQAMFSSDEDDGPVFH